MNNAMEFFFYSFLYAPTFVNYFRAVCLIADLLHIILTFKIQNGK